MSQLPAGRYLLEAVRIHQLPATITLARDMTVLLAIPMQPRTSISPPGLMLVTATFQPEGEQAASPEANGTGASSSTPTEQG